MDIEGIIIYRLTDAEKAPSLFPRLKPEWFTLYPKAYGIISSYAKDYGTFPDFGVVTSILPVDEFPYLESYQNSDSIADDFLVDAMVDKHVRETVKRNLNAMTEDFDKGDVNRALTVARSMLAEVNSTTAGEQLTDIESLMGDLRENYNRTAAGEISGVPFYLGSLKRALSGLEKEEVAVIAARPATGKTWLLLQMAYGWWSEGYRVLFVSPEMGPQRLARRFMAIHGGFGMSALKDAKLTPNERTLFDQLTAELESSLSERFKIMHEGFGGTIEDIESAIASFKPDVVVIDAIYALRSNRERYRSMWESVSIVTNEVKRIANQYSLPILASTQFNKTASMNESGSQAAVAYSDAINQSSDYVFSLSEVEGENPYVAEGIMSPKSTLLELKLIKARDTENDVDILIGRDLGKMLFYDFGRADKKADDFFTPEICVAHSIGLEVGRNEEALKKIEQVGQGLAKHSEARDSFVECKSQKAQYAAQGILDGVGGVLLAEQEDKEAIMDSVTEEEDTLPF